MQRIHLNHSWRKVLGDSPFDSCSSSRRLAHLRSCGKAGMREPPWILDQQLQFGINNVSNGFQKPLQQLFNVDYAGISKNWLIEGYKAGKLKLIYTL
jgi:hypothetical protein